MLLRGLQRRSTPLCAPFATVTASVSPANGLVVLGAAGTILLVQRIRRGLKAGRERQQAEKQNRFVQVQVHAVAGQAEDLQWERNSLDARSSLDLSRNVQNVQQIPLLEETLPLTVRQVWELIYDHNFQQSFHDRVRDRECQIGNWQLEGSELVRRKTFIHPVKKNAVGPSEAFTEEECQCLQRNDDGFVVEVQAFTREVPYGRSFHVQLSWTARKASESSTKLVIVGGVAFTKKLLLGSFIRSAAHEGLAKGYKEYADHIWESIRTLGGPNARPSSNAGVQSTTRGSNNLRRLDSTQAAKAMVEDLVKNGIFVSWWTVLSTILLIWLIHILIRLSASQNGRLLASSF